MTFHEKWKKIDHRLRELDAADQEENQNLVLIFNGTGNDPENPRYSALW